MFLDFSCILFAVCAFFLLIVQIFALGPLFTLDSSSVDEVNTEDLEMADLDGDGDLDYINGESTTNSLIVYVNNGTGTYSSTTISGGGSFFSLGDVDNDNDIDIAANTIGVGVKIYKNNGLGSFSLFDSFDPGVVRKVKFSDVNSDGTQDLVFGFRGSDIDQGVYLNNGNGVFTPALSPIINNISFALADFNGDGHLDLAALTGGTLTSASSTIFLNTGTGMFKTVAWHAEHGALNANDIKTGDFNSDGYIDYAVSVLTSPEKMFVYLNDGTGTSFSLVQYTVNGAGANPAIADIDNNGSHDIIAALSAGLGNGGSERWINNGSAVFSYGSSAAETSDVTTRVVIGDIDNDTDLDYISGARSVFLSPNYTRRYKSNQSTILPNTAPSPPSSGFGASRVLNGPNVDLTLVWGAGSDAETLAVMLQYAVKVGTVSGGQNIVSAASASPHYVNRVLPNSKSKEILIKNLPCNATYYWSVAAVDSGLKRGAFSSEYQTIVDSGCNVSTTGGGGGGSGGSSPGGGYSRAKYPYPYVPPPEPKKTVLTTFNGMVWMDFDKDGVQDDGEEGLEGVAITASDGSAITSTTTDKGGGFTMTVPASEEGYRFSHSEIEGMTSTTANDIVASEGDVLFGVAPSLLRAYAPCITVRDGDSSGDSGTPAAERILGMLSPQMPSVPRSPLLTRRSLFQLTSALFCLRGKVKNSQLPTDILRSSQDAELVGALLANSLPVLKGKKADLNAYAKYSEMSALLGPLLSLKKGERVESAIGIKTQWKSERAISRADGIRNVLLAAYANGNISLARGEETDIPVREDAFSEAFKYTAIGRCLSPSPRNVYVSNLLPGEGAHTTLAKLHSLGIGKGRDHLFLIGVTLSNRGLLAGRTSYVPDQPVLWLPFLRTLSIAFCSPPQSVDSLRNAFNRNDESGPKEAVVVPDKDLVFGVPSRSLTLATRIGLAASRIKADGYSTLFSFARDMLATPHDPKQSVTLHEASRIISSAIVTAMIRQQRIPASEGSNLSDTLTRQLLDRYRGTAPLSEAFLRDTLFTQAMWMDVLHTILKEPLSRVRMPPRSLELWRRLLQE